MSGSWRHHSLPRGRQQVERVWYGRKGVKQYQWTRQLQWLLEKPSDAKHKRRKTGQKATQHTAQQDIAHTNGTSLRNQQRNSEEQFDAFDGPGGPRFPVDLYSLHHHHSHHHFYYSLAR
jgi:hypothetical protein